MRVFRSHDLAPDQLQPVKTAASGQKRTCSLCSFLVIYKAVRTAHRRQGEALSHIFNGPASDVLFKLLQSKASYMGGKHSHLAEHFV